MRLIRTLTLTQLEGRLRELGISTSLPKTKTLIEQGLFEGVVYKAGATDYLILEKKFEEWVNIYCDDISPSAELVGYVRG